MLAVVAPARRICVLLILVLAACGSKPAPPTKPKPKSGAAQPRSGVQRGLATWYGGKHHGGPTASGERFDKRAMTAAHLRLPMNTRVRVTNTRNGRTVLLRINDRGPYGNKKRIIDVSEAAAEKLDMIEAGVVPVTVEVIRTR